MSSSLPATSDAPDDQPGVAPGPVRHLPEPPASPVDVLPASPVDVLLLRLDDGLPVPGYEHDVDAGADLRTAVDVTLQPGERATVPTGVAIALPPGYAGFVHPRSGLAARHGVTVVNAPGTVDAGYRGEIRVTLLNTDGRDPVALSRGDRVAQLVVQRVERAAFVEVEELPGSARGTGGHGSTGGFTGAAPRRMTRDGATVPEGGTR